MTISAIIPTLNAGNQLRYLVYALKKQTVCPDEIIIIDSSSGDQTELIATELGCRSMVIDRTRFDHGGTRNYGAGLAIGDILLFLTQDAVPFNSLLIENLITPLSDSQVVASFARQIAKADANPPEQFARQFNYPAIPCIKTLNALPAMGVKTFFFSNVCSAIKKQAYHDIGGFPDKIIMNEDMILAAKLILSGSAIVYCPDAMVRHSHNYNMLQYFKRYFDIGVSLKMNSWIFNYIQAESEGIFFAKQQLNYLINNNYYQWIPYTIALLIAKYIGFQLGLIQEKIPARFKRYISANNKFWS